MKRRFSDKLRRKQLDGALAGRNVPSLRRGYIREIRDALGMSSYQLAERMGISRTSVKDLERNEQEGTITLRSLARAADALGCTLVYSFVPKTSLEEFVRQQAVNKAATLTSGVQRTMALEQQSPDSAFTDSLIDELADEIERKGGKELWGS